MTSCWHVRPTVGSVNFAFTTLRTLIPTEPADRKLSKIETLRLASSYISHLGTQLIAGIYLLVYNYLLYFNNKIFSKKKKIIIYIRGSQTAPGSRGLLSGAPRSFIINWITTFVYLDKKTKKKVKNVFIIYLYLLLSIRFTND